MRETDIVLLAAWWIRTQIPRQTRWMVPRLSAVGITGRIEDIMKYITVKINMSFENINIFNKGVELLSLYQRYHQSY